MTVVLVILAVLAAPAVAVTVVRRRRRSSPTAGPVDRAELQARQRATGRATRTEHGYGADRTFGGGGTGSGL